MKNYKAETVERESQKTDLEKVGAALSRQLHTVLCSLEPNYLVSSLNLVFKEYCGEDSEVGVCWPWAGGRLLATTVLGDVVRRRHVSLGQNVEGLCVLNASTDPTKEQRGLTSPVQLIVGLLCEAKFVVLSRLIDVVSRNVYYTFLESDQHCHSDFMDKIDDMYHGIQ